MQHIQDLFISNDIVPIFDHTINEDARALLNKMMLSPLSSVEDIVSRQELLKVIVQQNELIAAYQYRKVDYNEVQHFLFYCAADNLKELDYLTYVFQKKKNNMLYGFYSQLIYFFKDLEDILKDNIVITKFPKDFQIELRFLLNYLNGFKLTALKDKIVKGKFGFKSIQGLNKIVKKKRNTGDTILFFEKLNLLEAYISIAKSIHKLDLNFVEVGYSHLTLSQLYHPLVQDAVKNDLRIEKNVVLITGANMSGKSTLLKTIGLCVYLAHLGLPIPAQSGHIPFYNHIFIQINHSDDLKNGYSHFMKEIMNLKTVVEQADSGKRCFAVFDELFKGTNHEDALAISKVAVKGLQKMKESLFFISTHLNELQAEIDHESIEALYVDCALENGMPRFSYKIKNGWSDLRIGQLLFQKVGLTSLLDR